MFVLILIAIVIAVIYFRADDGYNWAVLKNKAARWVAYEDKPCIDCKYCCRDDIGKYSDTGYFCRLSNCKNITESTKMRCFEMPTVTEDDLKELFDLGIWNNEGKEYLRNTLLNKKMTFRELDDYLTKLPLEHPEFIDEEAKKRYQDENNI